MYSRALLPFFILLMLASLLSGCSASGEPRLIAAFPSGDRESYLEPPPPPIPPVYPQPPQTFIYNARLSLEAWFPSRAASRAESLVYGYGGYLVSSGTFYLDNVQHTTLVLEVPVYSFHSLYGDLHDLGLVVGEQILGEWREYTPGGAANYSQITLDITPRRIGISLPAILPDGWSPLSTLTSALRLSRAIFRTLVDAAIWLLVVLAPFALLFLGLRFVMKRLGK